MAEVLVIDGGGRGQAIAQAMEASAEVSRVVVTADVQDGLSSLSKSGEKPLVIIGPEAPLVDGLADDLREDGYPVFGASKEAAQFEASKSRGVKMARANGIFHPDTFIAEGRNLHLESHMYVSARRPLDYVIKADGLAGGKGVILPNSTREARHTVDGMLSGELFKGAGSEIINFADRHEGAEVSAMAVVGGGKDDFVVLPLSQDHKRLLDGDKGPNTGGMGAYAPVPDSIVNAAQYQKIEEKVYASLAGMEAEGVIYQRAVLYLGLMMSNDLECQLQDESMLLEYNVRFGDPEIQAVSPLLQHAGVDQYRLLRSAAEGGLEKPDVDFRNIGFSALSVCLAAAHYPDNPRTGDAIAGLNREYPGVTVQLAGVAEADNGELVTDGGRVLYVTGVGNTTADAADNAYGAIGEDGIHFSGMSYRRDIGHQARQAA